MSKVCYVCGTTIEDEQPYYSIGGNSYICNKNECFDFYFWDDLATRMIHNMWHEYAIINREVYQIGSEEDDPRGYKGKYWAIQFNDGTYIETHSLWYKGKLPARLDHDFPDNAKFIAH